MSRGQAALADEPLTRWGIPTDRNLRLLALGSFANRFGMGAVVTTTALYFTRVVGFSAGEVAFALGVAAAAGLLVQVPAGQLGDERGPRKVLMALMGLSALLSFPPALATTPVVLTLLLAALGSAERAAGSVYQGVIAQLATGGRGVQFKAYLRAVTNVAIGLGSLCGGAALLIDETWAYLAVFALNAVVTAAAAATGFWLPDLPPYRRQPGEPRLAVLRDLPYVAITALTGLYALHFLVMELGLALFISERTEAPTVMVAVLLFINTMIVALFQVRASRSADSAPASARALLIGSIWIGAGFVVIGFAQGIPRGPAIAVLVAGSLIHVVGEMVGSGGQWGLQIGLAPHERQGQYQGFAGLGFGAVNALAPPLVAYLCVEIGEVGWLVLAGVMVGLGVLAGPVSAWALASRERYGVTTHSG